MGYICNVKEEFMESVRWYEKGLAINETHYVSIIRIANSYFSMGDCSKAIEWALKARRTDSNLPEAY